MKRTIVLSLFALAAVVLAQVTNGADAVRAATQGGGPKRSDAVVKVTSEVGRPSADGQETVTLTLTMERRTWHVYAHQLPPDFPGVPTAVEAESHVKPQQFQVDYPAGRLVKDATLGDYHVYENQVEIKVKLRRGAGDSGPIALKVSFQACWQSDSGGQCLLPANVRVTVP